MIFDFTAYDGNTGLDVAALVYDINSGSPTLVDTVTMDHVANGSYYGSYNTNDTKEYLIQVAAYTDGSFTTRHTDYTPGSVVVQIAAEKIQVAAIKAQTDQLNFDSGGVFATIIDTQLEMKRATDFPGFTFPMSDSSSNAPKIGASVTAEVSIDGAAFTAATNSPVEIGNGMYAIDLDAVDLDGDSIILKFTASGSFQRTISLYPRG